MADALPPPVSSHLLSILSQILADRPADPLAAFESISNSIKSQQLDNNNDPALPANQSFPQRLSETEKEAVRAYADSQQALLGYKAPVVLAEDEEEPEEEEKPEIPAIVPDLVSEFRLFEQAGISLPAEELYKLQLSLDHLASTVENLENIRFWGKIYSQRGSYYVVETKLSEYNEEEEETAEKTLLNDEEEEEEDEQGSKTELWGTGPNEFLYFVSGNLDSLTSWAKLPLLTPQQIIRSATNRRFLSGELDAPVYGLPRFPGTEKNYLRAIIARISHSTVVVPAGKFTADEQETNIILENEEFKGISAAKLKNQANWVHSRLLLLKQGRTEPWIDPEEEENEEIPPKYVEKTPIEATVPLLRPISLDNLPNGNPAWSLRASSALETGYKPLQPALNSEESDFSADYLPSSHTVVSAHSNIWPGAVSVAKGASTGQIYMGWGLRALERPFQPLRTFKFQQEFVEKERDQEQTDVIEKPRNEEEDEEEEEEEQGGEEEDEQ
jgi:radial spoke head protein 4A